MRGKLRNWNPPFSLIQSGSTSQFRRVRPSSEFLNYSEAPAWEGSHPNIFWGEEFQVSFRTVKDGWVRTRTSLSADWSRSVAHSRDSLLRPILYGDPQPGILEPLMTAVKAEHLRQARPGGNQR